MRRRAPNGNATDDDGVLPLHGPAADAVRLEGAAAAHRAEQNRLLRTLPLNEYAWLLPRLTPRRLHLKDVLIEPEEPISHAWFLRDGVASIIATEQQGGGVEVGTVGYEGFVGLPLLFEVEAMNTRVIIQVEGDGWRISRDDFARALDERRAIRSALLRYAAYFTEQMSQSVACNRLHTLEERCARWLLMTHDRVHRTDFELTHEFLAYMLGVRRAGVTVAMGTLQNSGIIRYTRGRIAVLDRAGLEEASCDCYDITQAAFERLLGTARRAEA